MHRENAHLYRFVSQGACITTLKIVMAGLFKYDEGLATAGSTMTPPQAAEVVLQRIVACGLGEPMEKVSILTGFDLRWMACFAKTNLSRNLARVFVKNMYQDRLGTVTKREHSNNSTGFCFFFFSFSQWPFSDFRKVDVEEFCQRLRALVIQRYSIPPEEDDEQKAAKALRSMLPVRETRADDPIVFSALPRLRWVCPALDSLLFLAAHRRAT